MCKGSCVHLVLDSKSFCRNPGLCIRISVHRVHAHTHLQVSWACARALVFRQVQDSEDIRFNYRLVRVTGLCNT